MLAVSQLRFERHFEGVFEPVDFDLPAGGLLWVTGANGSGKTTLLRLLAGILEPSGGSIHRGARATTYVGHYLAIKDDLSVEENLRFMCDFFGGDPQQLAPVMGKLGITRIRRQLARTLSAGQRKRCALARLLLNAGELWLLDEPHANLDKDGIDLVDELVRTHVASGGACVLVTHGQHQLADESTRLSKFAGCHEMRLHLSSPAA